MNTVAENHAVCTPAAKMRRLRELAVEALGIATELDIGDPDRELMLDAYFRTAVAQLDELLAKKEGA